MSPSILQIGPNLAISLQKICEIIDKARKFDVRDAAPDFDNVSNAPNGVLSIREHHENDPGYDALMAFIAALSPDEQIDLIALTWLGRGDAVVDDWDELRAEATRVHGKDTAKYLLGVPLLPDHLDEALSELGWS